MIIHCHRERAQNCDIQAFMKAYVCKTGNTDLAMGCRGQPMG